MNNKSIKILAVDDNRDNLVVLEALINDLYPSAVFDCSSSGSDGLRKCLTWRPDVVLLDIVMPGMDGFEVCSRIKANDELKTTPVIMVTAERQSREARIKALEAGTDAFLSKPVDASELKAQINAMLKIKEAEDHKIQQKLQLEELVSKRTQALEIELADRKKAEKKLIQSLDKLTRNRKAILNLMEDLKSEMQKRKETEQYLSEERNLLRAIINNIPDTIYLMDRDGRKVISNTADLDIIGCNSEEDVLGKTDIELFPGPTGMRFHEMNLSVMQTGIKAVDNEEHFTDKFGKERWLYSSYYPLAGADGKITGLVGIGHDVTEKKIAEQKLDEVNSLNKVLLQTIPFGMDIVDESGLILFQSEAFVKLFGADAVGKECWSIYRDDKTRCEDCPLVKGIIPGITESYISKGVMGGRVFEIIHTGMIFQGKKAMLEIFMDITDRKLMEERIIESELYYRTLIDISPDGIIVTDTEGLITYSSVKSHEIFSIPEDFSVTGTSVLRWIDPDYTRVVMERIADILSGDTLPHTREYKLLDFNGKSFWAELSSSPLTDKNGTVNGLMIVCRDVSERKKAEEELIRERNKAEESDRLKTAFLHNISHEIRTPMNAIIGFSALLGEPGQTDETRASFIEVINNSSNHLLAVVSDIIEISNIEAGILKYNEEVLNLSSLLKNLNSQFILKAQEKGLDLNYNISLPQDRDNIYTDKTKLTVILNNLLSNALKFTHRGYISLSCELKNEFLRFTVSDTGIGIPQDKLSRIFDRFYQVESTVSRSYEGTGLGLAISKAYVEFLGGSMSVESEQENGSVFCFTIPYKQRPEVNRDVKKEANGNTGILKTAGRILIAEDEDNNYKLLVHYLAKSGIDLVRAYNGLEAVEICKTDEKIRLVLMDIKMPVMDGYEATRQIKHSKPGIPVIAQTAYSFESDMERALEAGCDEWISKPVKREKLLELIKKYCIE